MIRIRPGVGLMATAALALALGACNDKSSGAGGPEKTNTPSPAPAQAAKVRQGATPAPKAVPTVPAAAPGSQPAMPGGHPPAGNMPAGHPPAGKMPAGHPPAGAPGSQPAGSQPSGATGPVKGTIKLDDTVKDGIAGKKVLFIIVRKDAGPGQKGGLIAAKKVPVTGPEMFPLQFEITQMDLMFPGTQLAGKLRLSARVDADGDAISKNPGDVIGKAADAVMAGSSGAEIVLDGKIP